MDSGGRERPTSRSRIHRKNVLLHALVGLLCFLFISSVKHKWIFKLFGEILNYLDYGERIINFKIIFVFAVASKVIRTNSGCC